MIKLTTLADVVAMMQAFVNTHGTEASVVTEDDGMTLCAHVEANNMLGGLNQKDWAAIILEGLAPMTKETLPEWLTSGYDEQWDDLSDEEKAEEIEGECIFDEFGSMVNWEQHMSDFFGIHLES